MKKTHLLLIRRRLLYGKRSPGNLWLPLIISTLLTPMLLTMNAHAQTLPPHYENALLKLYLIGGHFTYGVSQVYDDAVNVGVGTVTPSEKLDVVGGNVRTTGRFISLEPMGNPPLTVSSTTLTPNLNSDMVDDMHATAFSLNTHSHTGMVVGSAAATQVAFWNSSNTLSGNNALYWDNTNTRLGIGTNSPMAALHIHSNNTPAVLKLSESYSQPHFGSTTKYWSILNDQGALRFEFQQGNSNYQAMTLQSSLSNATLNVNGLVTTKRLQITTGATANFLLSTSANGTVIWKDPTLITGWTVSGNNVYKTNGAAAIGTTDMDGMLNISTPQQPAIVVHANQAVNGYALLAKIQSSQVKAFAVEMGGQENFIIWGNGFLQVDNSIRAREVEVSIDVWHDEVFRKDYLLLSLKQLEEYISCNSHLPGIPSEKTVLEEGIALGAMNALLLQKIEELTLYVIALNNTNNALQEQINELKETPKP